MSNLLSNVIDLQLVNDRFKNWVDSLYEIPKTMNWDNSKMEYRFKVSSTRIESGGIGQDVFVGDDYAGGKLNWYSMDKDLSPDSKPIGDINSGHIESTVISMIPKPAEFPGMPKKRFWEMENAQIDFGSLEGDLSEVIKTAVAEYALVYSNDWFVVPYDIQVGTLNKVNGITVKDVFGETTIIRSAIGQSEIVNDTNVDLWARWNMFGIDSLKKNNDVVQASFADHDFNYRSPELYIPSVISNSIESEPIEMVEFIRDEIDNYVWAIESKVFDFGQASRDGKINSNELEAYLRKLLNSNEISEKYYAKLVYNIGSEIRENWIPFIPVHNDANLRSIKLQRASLPRTYDPLLSKIRPVTELLRIGINNDDTQEFPMYLNEEVIQRAGIKISDAFQRTRWYNGKTYLWYGRKKKIGRISTSSGLNFDNIVYKSEEDIIQWKGNAIEDMVIETNLIVR